MRSKVCISLIVLLFLSTSLSNQEVKSRYWWQLELVASVKGESRYGNQRFGFSESFKMEICGNATFERDNGDYLLFPGNKKIRSFIWEESIQRPGLPVETDNISEKIKPNLVINYVVRRRGKLYIDFELGSIKVPTVRSFQSQLVFLPRSAENRGTHPEDGYNRGVGKGSNMVRVEESQIYQRKLVEEGFEWQWSKRNGLWKDTHQISLMVRIQRFLKED